MWTKESPALIGAVDPRWLAAWINDRGPWLFHVTAAKNVEAIERHGLLPASDRVESTIFKGVACPRDGHIYFSTDTRGCDDQWELSGLDPSEGAVICADLRAIDPRRIVPDEDPWTLGVVTFPADPWGLGDDITREIGEGRRWRTGGDWAQDVLLGSQPGIVEWAFSEWGRVALAGSISPRHLAVSRCDPTGRWEPPQ